MVLASAFGITLRRNRSMRAHDSAVRARCEAATAWGRAGRRRGDITWAPFSEREPLPDWLQPRQPLRILAKEDRGDQDQHQENSAAQKPQLSTPPSLSERTH